MTKLILLFLMAALYILAGLNHFRAPKMYLKIMPQYIPWHLPIVYISGIVEIILGILLLIPETRTWAAWGIILLLILIFPANIQMAVDFYVRKSPYLWLAIFRLPLQILLVWWAWWYVKS